MAIDYHLTPIGWLKMIVNEDGILNHLSFEVLESEPPCSGDPIFLPVHQALDEYFAHQRKTFTLPYNFIGGTSFQRSVWEALCDIPYGETRTYQQIALQCCHPQAYQAVGQAVHCNPIAIIVPCHRVIGKSGDLTGYRAGLDRKAFLLALESKGL